MSNLRVGYSAKFFKHIPSDWGLIELKKLVKPDRKITYGIVQPGQYDPNGILLIRGQDYMTGWAERGSFFKVSPALHQKFKRSTTRSGDVLISIAGYTGTVAVVPSWIQEANLTQTTARICCKPDLMDGLYLSYFLQSDDGKLQSKRYTKGSAQEGLNLEDVEKFLISVPPLPEQQKIATILSSVDDVIEKTRAQIDKLKDLKTGMMQELLTKGIGHTEFKDSPVGRIPLSWSIAELRDVCTSKYAVVDGPFGSNLKTEHYRPTGIPVFQSGFVTSGRFVKREYVYVDAEKYNEQIRSSAGPGDILMAKIGMNAGACAIIPEDHSVGILAGNSLKMTVDIDKISNTYLLSILHLMRYTGEMRRLLTETAQPAVSITTLKSLKLALPPLQEQHEITGALNSIDSKYTSIVEKLVHLKQIKKALMQDLLTGKVRVNLTDKESAVV